MEAQRLKNLGLIASFADYAALPLSVLYDARLVMDAQDLAIARAGQEAPRGIRR